MEYKGPGKNRPSTTSVKHCRHYCNTAYFTRQGFMDTEGLARILPRKNKVA